MAVFGTNYLGTAVQGIALRGSTIGITVYAHYLDQCGLNGDGDRSVVTNMSVGSLAACLPLASTNLINPANSIPPGHLLPDGCVVLDFPVFPQYAPINVIGGSFSGASYVQPLQPDCIGTLLLTGNVQGYDTNGNSNVGGLLGAQSSTSLLVIDPKISVTASYVANGIGENSSVIWSGTVTNSGDTTLEGVAVVHSHPPEGLTSFGPISLRPGEGRTFSGSYSPKSLRVTNVFAASGTDAILGFKVSAQATNVIFTQSLPKLELKRACVNGHPSVVVSWSTNFPGYVVRTTTNLTGNAEWTTLPDTPSIVGDRYHLTNSVNSPRMFFQLCR